MPPGLPFLSAPPVHVREVAAPGPGTSSATDGEAVAPGPGATHDAGSAGSLDSVASAERAVTAEYGVSAAPARDDADAAPRPGDAPAEPEDGTLLGDAAPAPDADSETAPAPAPDSASVSTSAPDSEPAVRADATVGTTGGAPAMHGLVGAAARRGGVIGADSTGLIPVHLLFRDDKAVPTGDDGGPDTVAMAPVAVPPGPRSAPPRTPSVAPSRRPAPPVDPKLHERPGPALPGWTALILGTIAVIACAGLLHWAGVVPTAVEELFGLGPRPYHGISTGQWGLLALGVVLALFTLGGIARSRVGDAWVLTLFGEYRGSVRRAGLMWVSPLLLRWRVDVRLRHWRSEPMPVVDANGTALQAVVLVVWQIKDTARAVLAVADHEAYLREQVEAAMARVLSQLPADAFHEDAPTLRNAEAVGDALTKTLSAECAPVGIEIFSAQPTRIEYAPEVAAAMHRRRIAVIDAEHRDIVLTSVVDAVDDTVRRLTVRGLVELDDYERKALVRDLTVAFCTARTGVTEGP
ncbi:membrane protease subunit [Streptomyces sp. FIT100]|nr:membrane protease subunit [Streptomyces sp. FIT100]